MTLLGITVSGIERGRAGAADVALRARRVALDAVLDAVRERFGTVAITRAALLDAGEELTPWLMPGEPPRR